MTKPTLNLTYIIYFALKTKRLTDKVTKKDEVVPFSTLKALMIPVTGKRKFHAYYLNY